ncbi:MAG: 16S rRNA (guanine(966)-N(2))-methyltransferase RsmD [Burkholderiales bacterium]|nr:16S rRNA (guanine(966)-N(2))-methyltransferase RsmD [Burkholderiales bacterium]
MLKLNLRFISKRRFIVGKIRIIGGKHRSLQLPVLELDGLRPTLDRVKETLFNWLGQDLTGMTCLDLFAGSGSLGFESVSRNAKQVVMIEKDNKIYKQLLQNKNKLKADNCELINQDAVSFLKSHTAIYDVIFVDPPYNSSLYEQLIPLLDKITTENSLIYIENSEDIEYAGFTILKSAKAGMVKYALLQKE